MKGKEYEYGYKALNSGGEEVNGKVTGRSADDAARQLNSQNLIVLELQRKYGLVEFFRKDRLLSTGKVKIAELSQFSKDLGIILEAGISILEALKILENRSSDRKLQRDVKKICHLVKRGESLSEAMSFFPDSFPGLFVFFIRTGEITGKLPKMLKIAGEYYEWLNENRQKMKEILFYPILLIMVSIGVGFFLLTVVLPQFIKLFDSMDQPLPLITRLMVQMSISLRENMVTTVILIFFILILGLMLQANKVTRLKIDQFKNWIPVYGKLIRWQFLMVFSKNTAIFLSSGVDILTVLEGMQAVTTNLLFKRTILNLKEDIKSGCSMTEAIGKQAVFEKAFVQFVAVGESSGSIGELMEVTAAFYESQYKHRFKMLQVMIEPALLILIGSAVLMMVMAIILPVFDLYLIYSNM